MLTRPIHRRLEYMRPFLLFFVVTLAACSSSRGGAPEQLRNRAEFASKLARVSEGMDASDVRALLGPPDDIRDEADPGGITAYRVREIWGYGTAGHLTFPVYGQIFISDQGKAKWVFGGARPPTNPSLFAESELSRLLRVIDRTPGLSGYRYDPGRVIEVVNALQPLGKEKALAAVDEYLRVATSIDSKAREGLFLVLRVLFDVPENGMPPMYVGAPAPSDPMDPRQYPRFPILLVDDLPLNLVWGYAIAGFPQPVEQHVEFFRKEGRLRARPLAPTNDPVGIIQRIERSPDWIYRKEGGSNFQQYGNMLRGQILRLLLPVYRGPGFDPDYGFAPQRDPETAWKEVIGDVARQGISWDASHTTYKRKDGTTLPADVPTTRRRQIWTIDYPGADVMKLILERRDAERIDVSFDTEFKSGVVLAPADIRLCAVRDPTTAVATFTIGGGLAQGEGRKSSVGATAGSTSFSSSSIQLPIAEGVTLQAVLDTGKTTTKSPLLKP